jgi:hypothetical protein
MCWLCCSFAKNNVIEFIFKTKIKFVGPFPFGYKPCIVVRQEQ